MYKRQGHEHEASPTVRGAFLQGPLDLLGKSLRGQAFDIAHFQVAEQHQLLSVAPPHFDQFDVALRRRLDRIQGRCV